MLRRVLALCALVAFPATALAQGDFADTVIESQDLGSGVYLLTGAGGNMGLCVGDDGAFLIDDQFAPLTEKILAKIKTLTDKDVRFVINTHWHGDHTGGNENLGNAGVAIVAHENVRVRLTTDQVMEVFGREVPAAPHAAHPVITFTENISFHLNGQTIRVSHPANAHTDGDAFIDFEEANVLHMGDVFFHGMYPFIDTGSGGSIQGVIAAVETALGMSDDATKIIPGHGALASKTDLQAYLGVLQGVRDAILPLVKAGKSVDEIVAADPLAKWNEAWGQGFMKPDVFTRIVAGSLGAK